MSQNGHCLEKIEFENLFGYPAQERLYPMLKVHPNIQVLKFTNCVLTPVDVAAIGKVLADFKQIKELDLQNTSLDENKVKEVADGLMRAKQLEILKIGSNPNMNSGINAVIYNLAFSPKIRHIDISESV
jgi:Ran GTPase-activating protein (RanGAP) involved in mRNA processing and transport